MPPRLLIQEIDRARILACDSAGNSRLARIAMIEITTRSSINVKLHIFLLEARVGGQETLMEDA